MKRNRLFLIAFLGVQLIVIYSLKRAPDVVETVYSTTVYPILSQAMRYVFGWIPFSIGDIFYTIASVYILRWLVVNRRRIYKDTLNWVLDITAVFSVIYFAFHVLWAYNYYRPPLYKSLNISADYSTEALFEFTSRLIDKSNQIHNQLSREDSIKVELPYSKTDIFNLAKNGYDNLEKVYPKWRYNPQSIKKSIYSLPLTYMGFSGYLNPFTNEAQVDGLLPTYKFPTTTCHEIAHQIGYAAENEANFIGCLAAINNDDLYFKYSGYTFALRYCIYELHRRKPDLYYELLPRINKGILANYMEVEQFWKSYENPVEPVFKTTFDNFLKANNQADGMKSYNYVVALLVNYFKTNAL
jgi:hypothetical protein